MLNNVILEDNSREITNNHLYKLLACREWCYEYGQVNQNKEAIERLKMIVFYSEEGCKRCVDNNNKG